MTFFKVLDTNYIHSLEETEESFHLILGEEPSFILGSRLDAGGSVKEPSSFVFSSGLAPAPWPVLEAFIKGDARFLTDLEGQVYGVRLDPGHALPEEGTVFEDFLKDLDLEADESNSYQTGLQGLDSPKSFSQAEEVLAQDRVSYWQDRGVRVDSPSLIGFGVEIGPGTHIESGVRIYGKTQIGKNCFIGSGSRIVDSQLGDGVVVKSSLIESSQMDEGSDIGPWSHLRPGAHLKAGVHIGNFVEVKKATVGEGSKAGHLAYIGDADLGQDVNISCGVIFCNYDGKNKHRTTVGDGAFLGSNANLVAPVHIDDEAFIAAGSTVTKDVGSGDLALERARQRNIPGYVEKKKARGEL